MNKAQDYLKGRLIELVEKFKDIRLEYSFEEEYNDHIVEVTPSVMFEDNEFNDHEMEIIKDFYDKFPDHTAMFTYSGLLKDMEGIDIIVIRGILYK